MGIITLKKTEHSHLIGRSQLAWAHCVQCCLRRLESFRASGLNESLRPPVSESLRCRVAVLDGVERASADNRRTSLYLRRIASIEIVDEMGVLDAGWSFRGKFGESVLQLPFLLLHKVGDDKESRPGHGQMNRTSYAELELTY